MSPLERSLLETISYFDLFDYPLTIPELWRYAWQCPAGITLGEVHSAVQTMPELEVHAGMVCLAGRAEIIQTRDERYLESERKFRKRRWFLWLLSTLPGVQAICIVNTLAYHNVRTDSDIDLLIIAQPHKIWSTRFFSTALAKLFGLRPDVHSAKDAVCLSFYITSDALDLTKLNLSDHDVHQAYWLTQIRPVYDPNNFVQKIWEANPWVKSLLPNAQAVELHSNRMITETFFQKLCHVVGKLLLWEWFWKKIQLMVLPKQLKDLSGPAETAVVVLSDSLLKFHTHDPRPELEKKWQTRAPL